MCVNLSSDEFAALVRWAEWYAAIESLAQNGFLSIWYGCANESGDLRVVRVDYEGDQADRIVPITYYVAARVQLVGSSLVFFPQEAV